MRSVVRFAKELQRSAAVAVGQRASVAAAGCSSPTVVAIDGLSFSYRFAASVARKMKVGKSSGKPKKAAAPGPKSPAKSKRKPLVDPVQVKRPPTRAAAAKPSVTSPLVAAVDPPVPLPAPPLGPHSSERFAAAQLQAPPAEFDDDVVVLDESAATNQAHPLVTGEHAAEFNAIEAWCGIASSGVLAVKSEVLSSDPSRLTVKVSVTLSGSSRFLTLPGGGDCSSTPVVIEGVGSASCRENAEGKACRRLAVPSGAPRTLRNAEELLAHPSELEALLQQLHAPVVVHRLSAVDGGPILHKIELPSKKRFSEPSADVLRLLTSTLKTATKLPASNAASRFNSTKGDPTPNMVLMRALKHFYGIRACEAVVSGTGVPGAPFIATIVFDKNDLVEKGIAFPNPNRLIEIGSGTSTTKKIAVRNAYVDALRRNFPAVFEQVVHLPTFEVQSVSASTPSSTMSTAATLNFTMLPARKRPLAVLTDLVHRCLPGTALSVSQSLVQNRLWVSQITHGDEAAMSGSAARVIGEGAHGKKDVSLDVAAIKAMAELFPEDGASYVDLATKAGLIHPQGERVVPTTTMEAFRGKPSNSLLSLRRALCNALANAVAEQSSQEGTIEEIARVVTRDAADATAAIVSEHHVEVWLTLTGSGARLLLASASSCSLPAARLQALTDAAKSEPLTAPLGAKAVADLVADSRRREVAPPGLISRHLAIVRVKQWLMYLYGLTVYATTNQVKPRTYEVQLWAEPTGPQAAPMFLSSTRSANCDESFAVKRAFLQCCRRDCHLIPHDALEPHLFSERTTEAAASQGTGIVYLVASDDAVGKSSLDSRLAAAYGVQPLHRYLTPAADGLWSAHLASAPLLDSVVDDKTVVASYTATAAEEGPLLCLNCAWGALVGRFGADADAAAAAARSQCKVSIVNEQKDGHPEVLIQSLVKVLHGLPVHIDAVHDTRSLKWRATVSVASAPLGSAEAAQKKSAIKAACRLAIERNFPREFEDFRHLQGMSAVADARSL